MSADPYKLAAIPIGLTGRYSYCQRSDGSIVYDQKFGPPADHQQLVDEHLAYCGFKFKSPRTSGMGYGSAIICIDGRILVVPSAGHKQNVSLKKHGQLMYQIIFSNSKQRPFMRNVLLTECKDDVVLLCAEGFELRPALGLDDPEALLAKEQSDCFYVVRQQKYAFLSEHRAQIDKLQNEIDSKEAEAKLKIEKFERAEEQAHQKLQHAAEMIKQQRSKPADYNLLPFRKSGGDK